jgi:hypothetical protein
MRGMEGKVAQPGEHEAANRPSATVGARRPAPGDLQELVEPVLSLASWDDAERLFRSRREALVSVDEPLVLISQLQRSGGTLLNSLLDGHSALHVHPYELHIGHPTKDEWPRLEPRRDPDEWLRILGEARMEHLFAGGYTKKGNPNNEIPPLPFTLVPSFLDRLFRLVCFEREPRTPREILACYFTAFFNAWLDCQGLRSEPKLWVAGFAPRMAWGESRLRFFADCPDGRVIACLRDPRGWYASASGFKPPRYESIEESLDLWCRGASEISAAKRDAPGRVLVLTFEALVGEPDRTMRAVADWLGLAWEPILTTPTFNRLPIRANSSYPVDRHGILSEASARWKLQLEKGVVEKIEARTKELYAEVRALADVH